MAAGRRSEECRTTALSRRRRLILTGAMLLLAAIFAVLGSWQVKRLFWKIDLIARVDARIHAEPVAAPAPHDWAAITADKDEYRRVTVRGRFDYDRSVVVQAVTERGPGFWLLTPLVRQDHSTVLINRGFVPSGRRDAAERAASEVSGVADVTGLLRMTEPGGAFLRSNDPAAKRWYSRDVAAIAAAQELEAVAPFFIDADSTPNSGGLPIGGLTVVTFRNSHLAYALTWYALALMAVLGAGIVYRRRSILGGD